MIDSRKLLIGAILIALAGGTWWYGRTPIVPLGAIDPKSRHDPDYIVENFTATAMNERGTPKYRLTARQLTHYPDDDTSHLQQPVLVQYHPSGAHSTTRADHGVMPGDGSEIVMNGNVHASRTGDALSAGGEIRSDRLRIELDR